MSRLPPDLLVRIKDRGFTPSLRDMPALFVVAADSDREVGKHAVRALVRLGAPALAEALGRFPSATAPLRARLCDVAGALGDASLMTWLLERLADEDGPTRRRAAAQLSRRAGEWVAQRELVEPVISAAFRNARDPADQRAFAEALGKWGVGESLTALQSKHGWPAVAEDSLLVSRMTTAQLRIQQRTLRQEPSTIRLDVALPEPTAILLHVRSGLEDLLLDELQAVRGLVEPGRAAGRGRVRVVGAMPLAALFDARTFLHLGFPLPAAPDGVGPVEAVVRALTWPATTKLLRALTAGPVRYRIHWSDAGGRRTATQDVARQVAQAVPWLINDATAAPWEVVVTEAEGKLGSRTFIELWPRRLLDPRFTYRAATMPASSHPTIAAALVRVAGVQPQDVVWDPFAGTGMELVERGLAGPYRQLWGTDIDPKSVQAAQTNCEAAGVKAHIVEQDAREFVPPEPVTLVITNPPFGQRVVVPGGVRALLEDVLSHAARQLAPHGRMAFITPRVQATEAVLLRAGLQRLQQSPVDVGGFAAHLELWRRTGRVV